MVRGKHDSIVLMHFWAIYGQSEMIYWIALLGEGKMSPSLTISYQIGKRKWNREFNTPLYSLEF